MECAGQGGSDPSTLRIIVWPPYLPGPYWPFPQLSVGDMHGIFMRSLQPFLERDRNQVQSIRDAAAELAACGVIGREEAAYLKRLAKIADGGDGPRMLEAMRELQTDLVTSVRPTPSVALAILSIGIDSLTGELAQGAAANRRFDIFQKDLGCAASGATIGAAVGNVGGAVIGALAGGIIGSILAAQDAREGAAA
jgi:hypothetical protein